MGISSCISKASDGIKKAAKKQKNTALRAGEPDTSAEFQESQLKVLAKLTAKFGDIAAIDGNKEAEVELLKSVIEDLKLDRETVAIQIEQAGLKVPAMPKLTVIEGGAGKQAEGDGYAAVDAASQQRTINYGKSNTLFTEDAATKARELLRKKLGQLNAGLDPEMIQAGITLAGYHIEAGSRKFAEFAKAMIADLGDSARPYLRSWYEGVRYYPGMNSEGMTPAAEITEYDKIIESSVASSKLQDGTQNGEGNAESIQSKIVPAPVAQRDIGDVANSNRSGESLDAGLAGNSDRTNRVRGVSGSADGARAGRDTGQAGQQPIPSVELGEERGNGVVGSSADAVDHVIDADDIGKGGLAKKYSDNIAAIKIIKLIEAEGRLATPEERKQIARYAGWGALKGVFDPANKQWAKQHAELKLLLTESEFSAARKSVRNAHYTSPVAVGAMFRAFDRLGVTGGRVLEPSVGVGNFFGLMPAKLRNASRLHGVELDSLTSRLVSALYPKAKIAQATGFQDYSVPSEFFDVVIGNPPFGEEPIVDMDRSPYSGFSIHNYFLAKGIDKLRPGGVMQVVVSHNFLDAKDSRARKWIGDRANLIGAVRLPNTAFKENAGTEVVTDILIFQKKSESELSNGIGTSIVNDWVDVAEQQNTNPKTGESANHFVSKVFVQKPELVLGKPSAAGTMYRPNEYTVESTGDIKPMLDAWVDSLPQNVFSPIDRSADSKIVDMEIPDGIKPGSFFIDKSGDVMQRGEDVMGNKTAQPYVPKTTTASLRMKGMIGLRDLLRKQMRLERSATASEYEIEANRKEMNEAYDAFLKKFGHINSVTNRGIFMDDTESQLLQALEFDYDRGISKATAEREGIEQKDPSAKKADIFQRRVMFPPSDYMRVETAKDALLASLNYRGKIDLEYMAEVYSRSESDIISELGDVVYEDPQSGIIMADEYLSGDVKTKLAEAKAAAVNDARFGRNVLALEKIIPADKKPSEISVSIGASFIPAEIYQEFIKHITGAGAALSYLKSTGQWLIDYAGSADMALNTGTFGTSSMSARDLFSLSMLGRGAVVKQIVRNPDGSTTTVVLEKETEAAREKQSAIKNEWQKWLWSDPVRADKVAAIYNDKMNRIVVRKYDGSHLTFPGMNPAISLLEHQKNGVWRGLQSFQVLYDHVVGAGKTFEMATLAMEMRRLGIARKPLFVVPNHLTLQWRSEFTRLYPGSNILAATPEDFSKENRGRMFSKIITGDWDAVILGHSSLKKIGLPEETERAVLEEQIKEVADAIEEAKRARGDRNIIRDMEGIKSRLEAKMKDKLASIGKRDKVLTFDELGVDAMFIDEMHEFKNLQYNSTMDRNPGMGNPAGSAKAFDLFVKTRWLFDTFGDKTPYITATGTPVSNSLVEMFNMQRYMQYPTLKREGLHVFDAWAKQFGSVENVYEVAPSGSGFRQSTRFAKFTNLPALMNLYGSFADTITLDDLKAQEEAQGKRFPVPKIVGGRPQIVVAERSPAVAELMGVPRAETNEAGEVVFSVQINDAQMPEVLQDEKTGKWKASARVTREDGRIVNSELGQFETEAEARLRIVEKALTPVVSVKPESILGRFADLKRLTKESKGKVNALSLTGEANKAGLDYRLIDPSAKDFPGSKINLAVQNMVRIYQDSAKDKGTQIVFCDMSIPLSARSSFGSKERRLYVRDDNGMIAMKRGTLHSVDGFEMLPFFIVSKGDKSGKRFEVYDAATGFLVGGNFASKSEARERAAALIESEVGRQRWIDKRVEFSEISQDQIDEFNNENSVETEGVDSFGPEDVAGISGSAKFSVYDDIKAKLIAGGVPEREIAFIHDFSTPVSKAKLFKAVNDGSVRFLLGSTPKMGAGTNVQERLVGLHHIDAPWRPSDLEQREGRIIRRGNKLYERDPDNFAVFIGRYATEQTYDTRRWQILEHKARGIEQLRNFDGTMNEIEDIDGEAANAADMKAAASGDPLILEETKLRNEVKRLERLQDGYADEKVAMERKANAQQIYADDTGPKELSTINALIAEAEKHAADKRGFAPVKISGKEFSDIDSATKEIAGAFAMVRAGLSAVSVSFRGQRFSIYKPFGETVQVESEIGVLGAWGPNEAFSPSGFVQRMINHVDRLTAHKARIEANIAKAKEDAIKLRAQAKLPFHQAAELDEARVLHASVRRRLMAKGPAVPESQRELVKKAIDNQKTKLREIGFGEALDELLQGSGIALYQSGVQYYYDQYQQRAAAFNDLPESQRDAESRYGFSLEGANGEPGGVSGVDGNEGADSTTGRGRYAVLGNGVAKDFAGSGNARLDSVREGLVSKKQDADNGESVLRQGNPDIGIGIAASIELHGSSGIIGRKVSDPKDLAEAAQIYRNPSIETARYFFVKQGIIVGQVAVSSRKPGVSKALFGETEQERISFIDDVTSQARTLGTDSIWMLHNHPDGIPMPSNADMDATDKIAGIFERSGFNVPFHVVINHKSYGVITIERNGLMKSVKVHDFGDAAGYDITKPRKHHALLGQQIYSAQDLAAHAKMAQLSSGQVVIIGISGGSGIRTINEVTPAQLRGKFGAAILRRIAKQTGSDRLFAYGVAPSDIGAVREAIKTGLLVDGIVVDNGIETSVAGLPDTEGPMNGYSLGTQDTGFVVEQSMSAPSVDRATIESIVIDNFRSIIENMKSAKKLTEDCK